ncbi:family 20 glycosylhydrolase [Dyella nitratireducens]|nr:family 20 glycosylhydrolase [Dyella nitratireducens]
MRICAKRGMSAVFVIAFLIGVTIPAGVARASLFGPPSTPLIPNVQQYTSGISVWKPAANTRIVLDATASAQLQDAANVLAQEMVSEGWESTPPAVVQGVTSQAADIHLFLGPVSDVSSPEGYQITVANGLQIKGVGVAGAFYATRTLLQTLRTRKQYAGTVVDWPAYAHRGVMVDIARKYFTPGWIEQLIRDMAWMKLNVLQLHISDNTGFGIQLAGHPDITTSPSLSRADVQAILAVAIRYHVEIIPDVDTPSHATKLLANHPPWQLKLANGDRLSDHIDYSIPAARHYVASLLTEVAQLFPGRRFHIGGDEYFPAPWQTGNDLVTATSAPQLVAYAQSIGGPHATLFNGFNVYFNELGGVLTSLGKTPAVWSDDIYPGDGVSAMALNTSTQIVDWIRWNDTKPNAGNYAKAGYPIINVNGDYLYFILDGTSHTGVGTGPTKNPQGIYETWAPRTFMGSAGNGGDYVLPTYLPMLGAQLSIWCDSPNALTETQVSQRFTPWRSTFAQQVWGSSKIVSSYNRGLLSSGFVDIMSRVGPAPAGVN